MPSMSSARAYLLLSVSHGSYGVATWCFFAPSPYVCAPNNKIVLSLSQDTLQIDSILHSKFSCATKKFMKILYVHYWRDDMWHCAAQPTLCCSKHVPSMHVLPWDMYFYACASMRYVHYMTLVSVVHANM